MSQQDKSQAQRRWVREEVVILVAEYFRTKNSDKKEIECSNMFISELLRRREQFVTGENVLSPTFRDYSGIVLQRSRIRCLDPETNYDGMIGTKLQKDVVKEYLEDPKKIMAEAYEIVQKYNI